MAEAKDKAKFFAFLVYEESAPADWRKVLKDTHGDYLISPLHSPDDEVSKPHFHVVYRHGNPVSLDCAKRLIPEGIPANGHLEMLHRPRNYQRYLLHLDDPDKEQFEDGALALEVINNFPVDLSRELSAAELRQLRRRCHAIIRANDINEYFELIDLLEGEGDFEAEDYASTHTIHINAYISSRRHSAKPVDE